MNNQKSFIVGEVFRHMDPSTTVLQYHGDNFARLIRNVASREVRISFGGLHPLSSYVSPRKMTDAELKEKTGSIPLCENQLYLCLYSLLIEPHIGSHTLDQKLRKNIYYFFHVILDSGQMVVCDVIWDDTRQAFSLDNFGNDAMFCKSFIYLYQDRGQILLY